ncbi:thioredoxin domain-containing protein [Christiangramia fulva]|uniref:Thioredoxin domain-containing protein n=1 Tax=Christiangramia fulva TaxID=2126553 RepID=A0A2R3Z4D4_9FLAO|nr:thioredoxin domain-containing protein [Christiangramia fulva]AVR45125.1 thioredoxin domain-containing protein [Christiangramia fulva]
MLPRLSLVTIAFILIISCFSCNSTEKEQASGQIVENRLANASSPYLREHADNPVDWYEWGPEALEKAKKEDKPIIISIGYAACHWCHVMEKESFMDTAVAAIMNKNFISIKVDREQRPDIDKTYMNAAILLNGSGGWPLNVIALPDGKPFFAGTYFPPDTWKKTLQHIATAYKEDKNQLTNTANALTRGIRKNNLLDSIPAKTADFTKREYSSLIENWKKKWDFRRGGYKGGQKFPLPLSWDALLEYYYLTGNQDALQFVNTTLTRMARGGIYDQVEGGFSRYTTDSKWNVPHFEKMLYDNAQLISVYSKAYKVTRNEEYEKLIRETINFVERELSNGKGGYYSSMNADTEGEEGKYYVWTEDEIRSILDKQKADLFVDFFNITPYGNWEDGKNILYRNDSYKEYAQKKNLKLSDFKNEMEDALEKLKKEREKRAKPTVDNKVLTAWNALMIDAYLDAYTALGEEEYLKRAIKTSEFLKENMIAGDHQLFRNYNKDGTREVEAFLDDYSYLSKAYIDLYQVNFDKNWLELANQLSGYAIQHFSDSESAMFYYSSEEENAVIARNFELDDNVLPSSNSVMAHNLYILGELTENKEYLKRSSQMLNIMKEKVVEQPFFYANWTRLMGIKAFGTYEVAIMGDEAVKKNHQIQKEYLPTSLFMGGTSENLPLLEAKLVPEQTLIYVCQNKTCKYPVSEVNEALEILDKNKDRTSDFSRFLSE